MIRLENVSLQTGQFSLLNVSLEVPSGHYAVLMGQTGSGKTTLLEAIIGLRPISSGSIIVDDRDVTQMKPSRRGIGYVPQDGALFSTMTVQDHLSFALRIRKAPREGIQARALELAQLLGITDLLDRTPHGLSGGERQRVALGRALSFRPRTLLLDEPLSALDEGMREEMIELLKRVQGVSRATILHVTHSRDDAEALADTIIRIHDGEVQTVSPA